MTTERGVVHALEEDPLPRASVHRHHPSARLLAPEVSTFIGRGHEIATVRRLLEANRLVTLTGPGGIGKTRLVMQVANQHQHETPARVLIAELTSVADPDDLPTAVASALRVTEQPDQSSVDALIAVLRATPTVLVLDNCEHVIGASATLADALLRACPELRILATSREPLRVEGETAWRVPSLSLPTKPAQHRPQQVAESESVRLFVERAQAHTQEFMLDEQNAPAVAQLCRKLDGIPLAIELAAARITVLSPQQISERLQDALSLLTHGARSAPERQQTLRATIDWSYGLLSQPEQRLFERLSVFSGGWSLDAAEAICADAILKPADVLDTLDGLTTRSLVIRQPQVDGAYRFRLLETLRQYAREKLGTRSENDTFRQRHAEFFGALAESLQPDLLGHGAKVALRRLEQEHDNLRAALQWFLDQSDAQGAQHLAGALGRFWQMRCHFAEGQIWLRRALSLSSSKCRTGEQARCLYALGNLTSGRGDPATADAVNREALAIWRELGDPIGEAWTLYALGQNAWRCGDYATAKDLLERGVEVSRAVGLVPAETNALFRLADIALDRDDHAEAERTAEETLARATAAGWGPAVAMAHRILAEVHLARGEVTAATQRFNVSLASARELGNDLISAQALLCLGQQALQRDDLGRAVESLTEALGLAQTVEDQATIARGLEAFGVLAITVGHTATGLELVGAAEALRLAARAHMSPRDRRWLEPYLERARRTLGQSRAESALRAGALLSVTHAVNGALELHLTSSHNNSNRLTPREREVADLVRQGLSNPQIARELVIGERTVQTHVGNILGKLGLDSRVQVATWVTEHRLENP